MTYNELMAESKKLWVRIQGLLGDPEATAEDKQNLQEMIEKARGYKAQAMQMKEVERAIASFDPQAEADKQHQGIVTPESKGFPTWGHFLQAVFLAGRDKKRDPRLVYFKDDEPGMEEKQMGESTGAAGGFLVPAEFLAQLQAVLGEENTIRSKCTVIRMRRRQITIPVLDQTGTTAGIPHWFGGMRFYWIEEATAKTLTEATFRQVNLVAHKLIGYTYAPDELVDDAAISLQDFLSGPLGMAGGVQWMEEYAFLQGTGAGQPLGVINAGATALAGRNAGGTVSFVDFAQMDQEFLPSARGEWWLSQSAKATVIQLNGPAGNPSYVWQANARDGVPEMILGRRCHWTEKLPIMGNPGDVLLADWRYYLLGDRQAATIESTQYDRWQYDQTSWRVVHRVDGQPWLSAPLTLQDGATQVSPFVILANPGS